jgi:hypothetical protein
MKREEQEFHKQVANLLDVILPATAFWAHYPAGGKRSRIEAAIMVGMGAKAGIPDIMIIWSGRAYWIELKRPGEKPTLKQLARHTELRAAGCMVAVATTLDEVMAALRDFNIPTKGRIAA